MFLVNQSLSKTMLPSTEICAVPTCGNSLCCDNKMLGKVPQLQYQSIKKQINEHETQLQLRRSWTGKKEEMVIRLCLSWMNAQNGLHSNQKGGKMGQWSWWSFFAVSFLHLNAGADWHRKFHLIFIPLLIFLFCLSCSVTQAVLASS